MERIIDREAQSKIIYTQAKCQEKGDFFQGSFYPLENKEEKNWAQKFTSTELLYM